jgi:hypothetical protein
VDAAPSAAGLAIDIAPCGRAAEGLAIDIAPCGRAAGRPPSWTLPRPLRGWRLTSRRAGVPPGEGLAIEIAPRGRSAGGGAGDWKSRRAGVPPGEGLAIGNRAARAFRRASTFVDAAPSAAGLAIDIAPRGRSARGGAGD